MQQVAADASTSSARGGRERGDVVKKVNVMEWNGRKPIPSLRWSRIWFEDPPAGTQARHEGRPVVRTRGRWVDRDTGEEVDVTAAAE